MFPRDPLDQLCWSRNRNVDICGCEVHVTSANQVSYGVDREREEVVVLWIYVGGLDSRQIVRVRGLRFSSAHAAAAGVGSHQASQPAREIYEGTL